jgi:hypothetical protein
MTDKEFDEIRDYQLDGKPNLRVETEEEAEERLVITLSRSRNKINQAR